MLIDVSWRGILAAIVATLRDDAGRVVVELGRAIVRAGERIRGGAPASIEAAVLEYTRRVGGRGRPCAR